MGHNPAHRAAAGGFPPQGGLADIGETATSPGGRYLGTPPAGGGNTGVRLGRDGDLHLQAPEYVCAIHCDATYYVPLPGGGAEAGIVGP